MDVQLVTQIKAKRKSSFRPAPTNLLQRKCACGGTPEIAGECAECRSKRLSLQRSAMSQVISPSAPPVTPDVLGTSGQPLDAGTRAFMEPRFGHDFSQVRVHADDRAAESTRAMNALAYTVGRDIVFGRGHYAPRTSEGKRLLAHELTHVIQQGGQGHYNAKTLIGDPNDMFKQEANHMANVIVRGGSAVARERSNTPAIQQLREPQPTEPPPIPFGPVAPQTVRIEIQREFESQRSTQGTLTIGGRLLYVIELPDHNNTPRTSRAPAGTYYAHIRTDGHLGWRLELEDVPGRSYIEIHAGNTPKDSLGCILPGTTRGPNRVDHSRDAMQQIRQEVNRAGASAIIEVIIRDPSNQPPQALVIFLYLRVQKLCLKGDTHDHFSTQLAQAAAREHHCDRPGVQAADGD